MTAVYGSLSEPGESLARVLARSGHRWGVWARDVPPLFERSGPDAAAEAMQDVLALGGHVLGLTSIRQASPTLDRGELRDVRTEATRLGVELQASLGALHPARYDAIAAQLVLDAGRELGITAYHVTFGVTADRFAASPSWTDQLRAGIASVRDLVSRSPAAVVMRTHEEMTTFELARLCDAVGLDTLRVGYSPVNVVTRLEDPTAAFERVADRVDTLFLDDYRIARTRQGAARRLCPLGDGVIPWRQLLADSDPNAVAMLDIHHAEFDMPFYDPAWLAHHPDLTVAEFIDVLRPAIDTDPGQTPVTERRSHGRHLLRSAAAWR